MSDEASDSGGGGTVDGSDSEGGGTVAGSDSENEVEKQEGGGSGVGEDVFLVDR